MGKSLQTCPHCGANLTLDDLRLTDCPYCRTALPHHARAAEHAALVNKMLAQQGVSYQVSYQHGAPPPPVQPMQGINPLGPVVNPAMPPQMAHQVQDSMQTASRMIVVALIATVAFVLLTALLIAAGISVWLIKTG